MFSHSVYLCALTAAGRYEFSRGLSSYVNHLQEVSFTDPMGLVLHSKHIPTAHWSTSFLDLCVAMGTGAMTCKSESAVKPVGFPLATFASGHFTFWLSHVVEG